MKRWELVKQLRRRLIGEISAEDLSRWAREKIMENDNLRPPLPVEEHDFLEDILAQCSVAIEPGQLLRESDIRAFIQALSSTSLD